MLIRRKTFRTTWLNIALAFAWVLTVFVALNSPVEKGLQRVAVSNERPTYSVSHPAQVFTLFFDEKNPTYHRVEVIASTYVNALAPAQGLVLPGTKNEKPAHVLRCSFDFMLLSIIPKRNRDGHMRAVRLLATRNQYRRVDFLCAYASVCRIDWYLSPNHMDFNLIGDGLYHLRFQTESKIVGGGRSNALWDSADLQL